MRLHGFDLHHRVEKEADYIIETKCTLRECGKKFNKSKTTIHKDMHKHLSSINSFKYLVVTSILMYNDEMKQSRGGRALALKRRGHQHD